MFRFLSGGSMILRPIFPRYEAFRFVRRSRRRQLCGSARIALGPAIESLESRTLLSAHVIFPGASIIQSRVNPANGHTYHLLAAEDGRSGLTWSQAEAAANWLGRHLVTVNDQAENDWIGSTFVSRFYVWTGLNDAASDGTFVWSSGESVDFANWAPGEPNNFGGDEDYVHMYTFVPGYTWNDLANRNNNTGFPVYGLVEIADDHESAYTFHEVARTGTVFTALDTLPSINSTGTAAFRGQLFAGPSGIFTGDESRTASMATSAGQFSNFASTSINDGGTVAFWAGLDTGHQGIFTSNGTSVTKIVDSTGPWGNFTGNPAIHNTSVVAFSGGMDSGHIAAATGSGGPLTTVAHSSGPFSNIINPDINDVGTVAFWALLDGGGAGIFTNRDGILGTIDHTDGPYWWFNAPSINSDGTLAYRGLRDIGGSAIVANDGSTSRVVADTDGPYASFDPDPAIDDRGVVAFLAQLDNRGEGIYVGPDPECDKVIRTGDALLGSMVVDLGFAREGLNSSGQVAFWARLADGTEAVIRAHPPVVVPQLTVVTHGFRSLNPGPIVFLPGQFPDWAVDMALAINERVGYAACPKEIINSRAPYDAARLPDDGSMNFILFDWAQLSVTPGIADENEVAGKLEMFVRQRLDQFQQRGFDEVDVHFIGHSRGAYVNSALIRELEHDSRIGFLQMTTLDPQSYYSGTDGELSVPARVDWADNYYQTLDNPEGFPVDGAFNIDITDLLSGVNLRDNPIGPQRSGNHEEVHDWYHWTIDTTDGDGPLLSDNDMTSIDSVIRTKIYNAEAASLGNGEIVDFERNGEVDLWDDGRRIGYYYSLPGGGFPISLAEHLTIAANDVLPGGIDHRFELGLRSGVDGDDIEILLNGSIVARTRFADLVTLTIEGAARDDTLTIEFGGGTPIPPQGLYFDGGTSLFGGDRLELVDRDNTNARNVFTIVSHIAEGRESGRTEIGGLTIQYVNIESVNDELAALDRVFAFEGGGETIDLRDGPFRNGFSAIASTRSVSLAFANPSRSLTVNAGSGRDIVNIDLDAVFGADVFVHGGDEDDRLLGLRSSSPLHLFGDDGHDVLRGGNGSDFLDGGVGDDWLFGGRDIALDQLFGGTGRDQFWWFDDDPGDLTGEDIVIGGRRAHGGRKSLLSAPGDQELEVALVDATFAADSWLDSLASITAVRL